jgi:hypothetical protein
VGDDPLDGEREFVNDFVGVLVDASDTPFFEGVGDADEPGAGDFDLDRDTEGVLDLLAVLVRVRDLVLLGVRVSDEPLDGEIEIVRDLVGVMLLVRVLVGVSDFDRDVLGDGCLLGVGVLVLERETLEVLELELPN